MERAIPATEFKTHFLRLLERATAGEEIIVSKHGKPVAKLVPLTRQESGRPLGGCMTVVKDPDALELDETWEASTGTWEPR